MHIAINDLQYPCTGFVCGQSEVSITGVKGLTSAPATGTIILSSDDNDFELRRLDVSDWDRHLLSDGVLTLTNVPEPTSPTADELLAAARKSALARISGKCSAKIYSGVTVNGKKYPLSKDDQDSLAIAQTKVDKGATAVIYRYGLTEASEITELSAKAYGWGVTNTSYLSYLEKYISTESSIEKLDAVYYGMTLPEAYTTSLTELLTSGGININDYPELYS